MSLSNFRDPDGKLVYENKILEKMAVYGNQGIKIQKQTSTYTHEQIIVRVFSLLLANLPCKHNTNNPVQSDK